MVKSRSYQKSLLEALKDPIEAVEYLNAALEEGDPAVFLLALRDVVDSHGGMTKLAASTSLNRENLYRMLSTKGNPEFFSLLTVLNAVGFRLAVEAKAGGRLTNKDRIKKIVLHPSMRQVKEPAREYALAADTSARSEDPYHSKRKTIKYWECSTSTTRRVSYSFGYQGIFHSDLYTARSLNYRMENPFRRKSI